MNGSRTTISVLGLLLLSTMGAQNVVAQDKTEISVGVDLVSRYIWRGLNAGDSPSIQPSITIGVSRFEIGAWGAYSMSNEITAGDEIDLWASYTIELEGSGTLGFLLTDYYFPNAGAAFSNFNNYDDPDGPGAHTLELGASFSLSGSVPLSFAGYVNVYNDAGNNLYFQIDYPHTVNDVSLDFFAGFTPGSDENPDYYGADGFEFINLGITATKEVSITDNFSFPVWGSFIVNPNQDISYIVVGFGL